MLIFKKKLSKGTLEVLYIVKERIKKKAVKIVTSALSTEELLSSKEELRGSKQISVIDYFLNASRDQLKDKSYYQPYKYQVLLLKA